MYSAARRPIQCQLSISESMQYKDGNREIFGREIWTLSESKRFILLHHISIIADTFKRFATIK
jgi:hypothetical protein